VNQTGSFKAGCVEPSLLPFAKAGYARHGAGGRHRDPAKLVTLEQESTIIAVGPSASVTGIPK
jgi:hypothetical protein